MGRNRPWSLSARRGKIRARNSDAGIINRPNFPDLGRSFALDYQPRLPRVGRPPVMEHPGLAASFGVRDDEIFSVLQDRSGATWYCTSKGIARQVGHSFTRLHPLDLWKAAAFRAYEDPQGSVWIASSIGLYRVTGDLLETPAPGLHARFFFAGKDGELWVGTNDAAWSTLSAVSRVCSQERMDCKRNHDGRAIHARWKSLGRR